MAATDYAVSGRVSLTDSASLRYVGLQGQFVTDTDRGKVAQRMYRDGTVRYLRIRVVSSSTSGTVTITLMKGTSDTALTKTISSGTTSTTVEDADHEVGFEAEDELSWRIDLPDSGGNTTTLQSIMCEIGDPP